MSMQLLKPIWDAITPKLSIHSQCNGFRTPKEYQLRVQPNAFYALLYQQVTPNTYIPEMIPSINHTQRYIESLLKTPWPTEHTIYECIGVQKQRIHNWRIHSAFIKTNQIPIGRHYIRNFTLSKSNITISSHKMASDNRHVAYI